MRGKGLLTCPLIGKSIQQMDAWGPANLIYQFLMQQYVCRVPRCCRGKISANVVIELLAKGSEKRSGLGGLERLSLWGDAKPPACPMCWTQAEPGDMHPFGGSPSLSPSSGSPKAGAAWKRPANCKCFPGLIGSSHSHRAARRQVGWDGGHRGQNSPQPQAGSRPGDRAAKIAHKVVLGQETRQQRMEMGDPLLGCSSAEGLCPAPNTRGVEGAATGDTGTYLQLHFHPIHRQHLILKEKRKGSEGRARLWDAEDPRETCAPWSPISDGVSPRTLGLVSSLCFSNLQTLVPAPVGAICAVAQPVVSRLLQATSIWILKSSRLQG